MAQTLKVEAAYEYRVEGSTHSGKGSLDKPRSLGAGTEVVVFYNPSNHNESLLTKRLPWGLIFVWSLSLSATLLALFWWLRLWRAKRLP
ncbi:DUF3592 domain-containing protein [Thiosocius teredinicola]